MFCTCSRIFSSSSLIAITRRAIAAELALAPLVLISRKSSCRMKSSRFADFFRARERRGKFLNVALHPRHFLADVHPLREDPDFRQQA